MSLQTRLSDLANRIADEFNLVRLSIDALDTLKQNTFSASTGLTFPTTNTLAVKDGFYIPIGGIIMWPSETIPTNFLKLEGQGLLRTEYPELYSVVLSTYGTATSTVFYLPDMRRRFPYGAGTSVPLGHNDGIAETARDSGHTHTTSNGGAHNHTVSYSTQANTSTGGSATRVNNVTAPTSTDGSHNHGNTGAGGYDFPHNTFHFVIRAL